MLRIGMLWYDNSGDPLALRIQRAAEYYITKYGQAPNCCHVEANGALVPESVGGIAVGKSSWVLRNHLRHIAEWMGVDVKWDY